MLTVKQLLAERARLVQVTEDAKKARRDRKALTDFLDRFGETLTPPPNPGRGKSGKIHPLLKCPTCHDSFKGKQGLSTHSIRAHGKKIPLKPSTRSRTAVSA